MKEETKKLYFDNPYQIEFSAKVFKKDRRHDKPAVILEQTCFYPESGGQPSDRGTINGIKVTAVTEEDGSIIHFLERVFKDNEIRGKINWERRFDHMQQHAGQHVLSQSFYELTGGETVSFHMGQVSSTVEIDVRKITEQEVVKVEQLANAIIFQNKEIKSYFVSEDRIADIPLRGVPKKSGPIRVVEITGFDYSACGGTHPGRTGEIGLVKILRQERIRNNIRFEFVCGNRALRDYVAKTKIMSQVATRFSVPEQEVLRAVEKLFSDFQTQKKSNKKISQKLSLAEAREFIRQAKNHFIHHIFTDKAPAELRFLALNIIKNPGFAVLLGSKKDNKAHVVLARSDDCDIDMREVVPIISETINGKGGGRPALVEIAGTHPEQLEVAVERARNLLSEKMPSVLAKTSL